MRKAWAVTKIIAWAILWFPCEVLCLICIERVTLTKRMRNKCYRKIKFIQILGQRKASVCEAQQRYRIIENGISEAEKRHGLWLFGKEGVD